MSTPAHRGDGTTLQPVRRLRTSAEGAMPRQPSQDAPARKHRRRRWLAVLLLAAMLLTSGGLLFRAAQLSGSATAENQALTDAEATERVIGEVSNAVARIFSYTPDSLDSTDQDAKDLLRGKAAKDYRKLFGQLEKRVAEQQLSLSTRVVRAGALELRDGSATLLLFLDQRTERKGERATSAAAQLSVTAELTGGHWRINQIKAR